MKNIKSYLVIILCLATTSNSISQNLVSFKSNTGKFGFIDSNTKDTIVKAVYDNAYEFKNGYTSVSKNGLWGILNNSGEEITPIKYESIYSFSNGYAAVYLKSEFGVIDTNGTEVIPLEYFPLDIATPEFIVAGLKGKYGVVNYQNEIIIEFKYTKLSHFYSNVFIATEAGKQMLISEFDKPLNEFKYDKIYFGTKCNHHIATRDGNLIFINKIGEEQSFMILEKQSNGLNMVVENGKYGYINKNGKLIVPTDYNYIGLFKEGLAAVCTGCTLDTLNKPTGGNWGFVNLEGSIQIPLIYENVNSFEHVHFGEPRALVTLKNQTFYIDVYNNKVESPIEVIFEE